jgi:hypothetical protein
MTPYEAALKRAQELAGATASELDPRRREATAWLIGELLKQHNTA